MTAQLPIQKERLEKIASWRETYGAGRNVMLPAEEAGAMARALLAAHEQEPVDANEAEETLQKICNIFRIGIQAQTQSTILTNVENAVRFAEHLHAIEREFFMVPGEPDEDYPDDEPEDVCLVNSWGSTTERYVEQFREALARVTHPAPVPDAESLRIADALEGLLWPNMALGNKAVIQAAIEALRTKPAPVPAVYLSPDTEYMAEDAECLAMNLDKHNVPKEKDGQELSLWGRVVEFCNQQAPVPAVPDERYQHLSELYHSQEKRLFKLAQRIKGPSFDKYAYSTSQAIDVLEAAIFGDSEDESRAAMLNGGKS